VAIPWRTVHVRNGMASSHFLVSRCARIMYDTVDRSGRAPPLCCAPSFPPTKD
jgi:hypothetical protein